MKARTVLAMLVCVAAALVCLAGDPNMGTWKLNEAQSTLAAGAARNRTVVYEPAGEKVKVIVDGVDADGKPLHHEWVGLFDGKAYPVTGDPNSDMRTYKRVDDRTLEIAGTKEGKPSFTGRIAVSADGKTRTVTLEGTDASGKPFESTAVYDKQ